MEKVLRRLIYVVLATAATSAFAVDSAAVKTLSSDYRITYDQVKMPNGLPNMGLLGIHSLIETPSGLYGGLAGYGGIRGSQGGLLMLGLETGWQYPILDNLLFDAGIVAGAAGGGASPVGGGLMWNPHIGLMYDFHYFSIGPEYSYINFPSGKIRSGRIGIVAEVPSFFNYIDPKFYGQFIDLPANWITHNYFAFYEQNNFQRPGTQSTNGQTQDGVFHTAGFDLGHYLNDNFYVSVKASGAFSGIPSGYMDVLGGLGYRFKLTQNLALTSAAYLGAGGGGNVDTGGGFIAQPTAGVQWGFTPQWGAWMEAGYMYAPGGQMRAPSLTFKLYRNFDGVHHDEADNAGALANFEVNKWRLRIMNQTYVHPKRVTSNSNQNINLVNISLDQFIKPYFYLTGQASSAYAGKGQVNGGPATGLIGVGTQTPPFMNHWELFAEGLIGASGGGGYDTNGGAIAEPVIGVNYLFNSAVAVQASVGHIFALKSHSTHNNTFNTGMVFTFGAPATS